MTDTQSDADKIRAKRLAKLGRTTPLASGTTNTSDNVTPPGTELLADNTSQSSKEHKNLVKDEENIALRRSDLITLAARPTDVEQTPKETGINGPGPGSKSPVGQPLNIRPSVRSVSGNSESMAQWEDRQLGSLLRVTLNSDGLLDKGLCYLKGTREELEELKQPILISTAILDQVFLEAANNVGPGRTTLDYLLETWKRIGRQYRTLRRHGEDDPKFVVIKEARRLCLSYCLFAVILPEMFGSESPTPHALASHLLLDPDASNGIDHDFLVEAVAKFTEDEAIKDAFVDAAAALSKQLAAKTMNHDYKPYMLALRNLVQHPAMINAMTESQHFLPPSPSAATFEATTFLGPFFAISPLQAQVTSNYFSAPATRDKTYIANAQQSLRLTLQSHQMDLLEITNKIIKCGKSSRERMLDWFAMSCNVNHKRRAMQVNHKQVSSDGFMINVTVCLDQLCEPFMDVSFSKLDRIDVGYLRRKPRIDIKSETKINADQQESDDFYDEVIRGTNNFISEIFFLTLAAHHYGTEAACATMTQLEKDLKRMQKHYDEVELERQKYAADPVRLREFDRALVQWKGQIERGMSYKFAVDGILLDEQMQSRSILFMRYVIVWLLRTVAPGQSADQRRVSLPLPETQTQIFKCLPEYFLEDIVGTFKFVMRTMPQLISSTQSDELIMLCVTFLRSSEYIKNPYLKAGLVTIMFQGIWPMHNKTKGVLGDQLNALPFANKYLFHSLLKFYVEVEATGAHTQFYDKFNIRFEIFQIIKCIWSNPVYRDQLSVEAAENVEFFVRFVNLLLNDVTFVLDESLTAFVQIHKLGQELADDVTTIGQTERREKEEALAAAQGKAKSYMQLTNETVAMLKLFTAALADAFTMPEIVQRLADMLDYNLEVMVGPKSRDLKVDRPEEYSFRPKTLLSELVDVYLNLSGKENFIMAVARDGRSYKPSNFESATRILRNWSLKSFTELTTWTNLAEKIKKAKEIDDEMEENYGDIPDDFLDPLMFTLMSDPVILPTSQMTIDRSSIRSHLLSDPTDPFNRASLVIEDVTPNIELKARIDAFKAEKATERLKASDVMDET